MKRIFFYVLNIFLHLQYQIFQPLYFPELWEVEGLKILTHIKVKPIFLYLFKTNVI